MVGVSSQWSSPCPSLTLFLPTTVPSAGAPRHLLARQALHPGSKLANTSRPCPGRHSLTPILNSMEVPCPSLLLGLPATRMGALSSVLFTLKLCRQEAVAWDI